MTTTILNTPAPARAGARKLVRAAALAVGALALACGAAQAAPHGGFHGGGGWHGGGYHGGGYYHGGYYRGGWGPGPFWGGIGLGLGLGVIGASIYDSPDYVVVNPPPVYYPPPAVVYPAPAVAPAPVAAAPAPIFYPRNGQTPAQTEADRQACNRWATTQPSAMADGSVFHRATLACMDGRGYTSR